MLNSQEAQEVRFCNFFIRKSNNLPAKNTGRNINPCISPSVTIPNTILKNILNNSLLEKAVTITPMNVETPSIKK